MSDEQNEHLNGLIDRFNTLVRAKYEAGVKEHGGNLWEKQNIIRMAKEEAVDLWVYLDTLEQQIADKGIIEL